MSIIGRLFGTEKSIEKAVEGVSKGLDALVYTDEEKAGDAAKERSEARSMIIDWMKNSQGQNLARRIIAFGVTGIWGMQYIAMQALGVSAIWADQETSQKMEKAASLIGDYAVQTNGAVMLVLAFYFAAPHMGAIVNSAIDKFGGKK